jgi:predicted amidohydrolase
MTCYDLRFPELALSLALQGQTFWYFLPHGFGAAQRAALGDAAGGARWIRPVISWRQGNVAIRILARVRWSIRWEWLCRGGRGPQLIMAEITQQRLRLRGSNYLFCEIAVCATAIM